VRVAEAAQTHDLQLRADLGNSAPSSASSSPPDAGPGLESSDATNPNGCPLPASAAAPPAPPTTNLLPVTPLGSVPIVRRAPASKGRSGRPMSSPGTCTSSGARWEATGRRWHPGCPCSSTRRSLVSSWCCVRNTSTGCTARRSS
jgi:hypothetical protein